jgi:hypothetical protein
MALRNDQNKWGTFGKEVLRKLFGTKKEVLQDVDKL